MAEQKQQTQPFVKRYDTIIAFLGIEVLALALFGFGGATGLSIIQIAGIFVGLLTIPYIRNNLPHKWKGKALLALLPLAILLALFGFGPFWSKAYYGGNAINVILYGGLTLFGGLGIFILGYGLTQNKAAKLKYILYGAFIGLGLFVLISGGYSLIRYGAFYAAKYKGMVYYYEGVIFPIDRETKALIGFEFFEVAMSYGKSAAVLLASSGVALIPMFKESSKKGFIIAASSIFLGWLDLLFTPYLQGILVVLATYLIMGLAYLGIHFAKKSEKAKAILHKGTNIVFFVMIGLVILGVLLLAIDAGSNAIANMNIPKISAQLSSATSPLGKLKQAFRLTLYNGNLSSNAKFSLASALFGCVPTSIVKTSIFEFDALYQTGFVGFFALLAVIFLGIRQSRNFLLQEEQEISYRLALVSILLAGFLFYSVQNDELPYIYQNLFSPLSRNGICFALIFLLGVIYATPIQEEAAHE